MRRSSDGRGSDRRAEDSAFSARAMADEENATVDPEASDDARADSASERERAPKRRKIDDAEPAEATQVEGAETNAATTESARETTSERKDDATDDAVERESAKPASGFGSTLSGSGFGGLKSTGGGFGGFGGFAAANASGGFASKPATPVFAAAPVALFGAGKKKEEAEEDEEGEEDPEAEVANDSIKPVVELDIIETKNGEEDETCAFRTEGALFEFVVDDEGSRWVERGRGDVHLNEGENGSRIVMRAKGNYRLMLNAALFKGQTFKLMEGGKGVSFTCMNAAPGSSNKMSTFALKMRAAASNAQSQADGFRVAATKAIEKLSETK